MIRGILFDMDGLMFDTERLSVEMWTRTGEEMGCPVPREALTAMTGRNLRDCRKIFEESLGGRLDFDEARAYCQRLSDAWLEANGVPLKPGLTRLLRYLREHGYRLALATSTGEDSARWLLKTAGVEEAFDGFVFGDQVTRGKPDPEVFLRAADTLALPPCECLVLEDSPAGLRAAHAAGCAPVMVPDLVPLPPEMEPLLAARCKSLNDVIPLLESGRPGGGPAPSGGETFVQSGEKHADICQG